MVNPDQKNVLMEIFMRKILLASTALVAVAGISAEAAEIPAAATKAVEARRILRINISIKTFFRPGLTNV